MTSTTLSESGRFALNSDYTPKGDQPKAIKQLTDGVSKGLKHQVLLGATGTGKTLTMAHVIQNLQRPTIVISPNKTLAAQLTSEFRAFFPHNAVEYFVSYYDYYQPEAYVPQQDLYIEKDTSINEELQTLRQRAMQALVSRNDVIVVASVSCIYGLGAPDDFRRNVIGIILNQTFDRDDLVRRLVNIRYERNDFALSRGKFRLKGDTLEISTANQNVIRIEFFGDHVERITEVDTLTGKTIRRRNEAMIYPATEYTVVRDRLEDTLKEIETELDSRLNELRASNKLVEAQRLEQRTKFDLEMLRETGYCTGVENYSRYMTDREPGETPYCLLDYFPSDYLTFIDESHIAIPQVRGMYEGDRSRKENLVNYGFRLPSAFDNRPLYFSEFALKMNQVIYTSATPGPYEMSKADQVVEQIIRPTGLLDPEILVRPAKTQVDDLIGEIRKRVARKERVLVTTLTKRMAEDLAEYLDDLKIKVSYIHSEVDTLKRIELLRDLRLGKYDVLVGINLLREGLDLPEVSLVAILDADKEGYLRSDVSLIQTIGRAARNSAGQVIMYADEVTGSMGRAIDETNRRREIQLKFNKDNDITPETVRKEIRALLAQNEEIEEEISQSRGKLRIDSPDFPRLISELQEQMKIAANNLEFESAARIRDRIRSLLTAKGKKS
ncbi:MAG: excinuclease ABC subunit UvrB [Nitrososphaerota archaeon]|nr:excinuclease ABC subunit UvrB [Nitrososphaerota archaeon]MDG6923077.1 excinuclease ABC subunit UvrB [Nitrososphaerota archaeon]